MEIEPKILEQNLRCPICWEIAEVPWETSCCGNLFCEKCMKMHLSGKCPMCRNKKFKFRKNEFAKNLLAELDVSCPYKCDKLVKLNKVNEHKYECKMAEFKCSIDNCKFEGNQDEALEHLIKMHTNIICLLSENYEKLKSVFDKFDVIDKIEESKKNKLKLNKLNHGDSKNNFNSLLDKLDNLDKSDSKDLNINMNLNLNTINDLNFNNKDKNNNTINNNNSSININNINNNNNIHKNNINNINSHNNQRKEDKNLNDAFYEF